MKKLDTRRGGFVKLILFIVFALIVLGFFGFDLRDKLNVTAVRENLLYVWSFIVAGWNWFVEHAKTLLNR